MLAWLRSPAAGVTPPWLPLGNPNMLAAVLHEDGVWRVRKTAVDEQAFHAFIKTLQTEGRPLFPEHVDRFQRPSGEVMLEAATLDEFIQAVEAYDWPGNW